jgi:hypothetical protein
MNQSVTLTFSGAQAAGDLIVLAVGWNDANSGVTSVTDTAGNSYSLAVGPTRYPPDISQSLYYAPGIHAAAAGANRVTVTFNTSAANVQDIRALEYSGLDPSAPLDVTASAEGYGAGPAVTNAVQTHVGCELLFGAGMTTWQYTGAGPSFTSRVVTSLGDIAEDRTVSSTGSYTASAPLGQASGWVMQLSAFH